MSFVPLRITDEPWITSPRVRFEMRVRLRENQYSFAEFSLAVIVPSRLLSKQCAAVSAHSGAMCEPEQFRLAVVGSEPRCSDTAHGYVPSETADPCAMSGSALAGPATARASESATPPRIALCPYRTSLRLRPGVDVTYPPPSGFGELGEPDAGAS